MRGVVLDICDKGEIVKLCLMIKLKFWEYKTRFDSKHFFFFYIIIVFEVTHLWRPQKNDQQMTLPLPPSAKHVPNLKNPPFV